MLLYGRIVSSATVKLANSEEEQQYQLVQKTRQDGRCTQLTMSKSNALPSAGAFAE